MHQSITAAASAPLPSPGLLRDICQPCKSRGWGICKFCTARGPGICQPRGHSRHFDTHAVSYQNINTQRVLLEKKADWLICQGQQKIEEGCKVLYMLIKPKIHNEIGAIDGNQLFLVIESNFCSYYFEEHPFIFIKLFITYNFTALY